MKNEIIKLLATRGVNLPPDASDGLILGVLSRATFRGPATNLQPVAAPPAPSGSFSEPLLGCDPKEVSPARAGAVFAQFARGLCDTDNCDLTKAWNKAKLLKPELHARMTQSSPAADAATLDNSFTGGRAPLAQKPFTARSFHLPLNVDSDIYDAAWRANGNQSIKVDSKKVFMGLVAFIAQKQKVSIAAARRQVQDDYPELARYAGEGLGN